MAQPRSPLTTSLTEANPFAFLMKRLEWEGELYVSVPDLLMTMTAGLSAGRFTGAVEAEVQGFRDLLREVLTQGV